MLGYLLVGGLAAYGIYAYQNKGNGVGIKAIDKIKKPSRQKLENVFDTGVEIKISDMQKAFGDADKDGSWYFTVTRSDGREETLAAETSTDIDPSKVAISASNEDKSLARQFKKAVAAISAKKG